MVCEMNLLALLTVVLDLDVYDDTRRVCRQSAFRTPHNHRLTGLHSTPSNVSAASCRTVRSSTREWRLLDVRVAQTQAYHRGNLSSRRCLLVGREGVGLLLLEHIDYTSGKGSERPNNAQACEQLDSGVLARDLRSCSRCRMRFA